MHDMAIFKLGHERGRWLAAKTAVIAGNVANADTPGYRARDVAPFESALHGARITLAGTQSGHLAQGPETADRFAVVPREGTPEKHSNNSVSLEAEMASLGEARSQQSTVTGVLGAFHRMLLASARG